MEFNPQQGAVSGMKPGQGWGQSKAVQAGVGGGLAAAKTKEARTQFERTFKQNEEQFNARMGWEKERFNKEQAFAKKQKKYTEKREAKAERIGMFGTALEVGKLGLSMANEADIDLAGNWGFGDDKGNVGSGAGASVDAGTPEVEARSMQGGDADVDAMESGGSQSGDRGGGHWTEGFTGDVGKWAIGGATGGVMGSYIAQGLFGEGKTQSTAGGAVGGAAGGYSASGTWQGSVGGAFVGGILGYLMG